MATTNTATLTLEYEDATTRNITFNDVASTALGQIKARTLEFNAALTDTTAGAPYKETFISDDGAPVKRIRAAKYVVTEEQVIYNG